EAMMNQQTNLDSPYLTVAQAQQLYHLGDAAHDFDHVLRVARLGVYLAQAEGADVEIVRLAAFFHDVPSEHLMGSRRTHHLAAAEFARQYLLAQAMETQRIENVVHCIEAHRFRDQSIQPQTLEAQCLYDADKLDSIGAIGVARSFAFAGAHNHRLWYEPWTAVPPAEAKPTGADYTSVHEFVYKLRHLVATLHTPTARTIGVTRHRVMVEFYEQLDAEMRQVYNI
ncbi:MAG: HD domain-containing protein, partial [Caldilineaceae bacterium]|nr:HD domain-containing protein [Caldilineaceae bacterium]